MEDLVFPPVPNMAQADLKALCHVCLCRLTGQDSTAEQIFSFKQLFTDGLELSLPLAEEAISPLKLECLLKSGLLKMDHGNIQACLKIQHYRGLIFLSDFFRWENQPDFVLSIGSAGRYLADLTIRRYVQSTLDLGCGCGVQSLLAAQHCMKVTATDINPRALELTRLNAALNGISNIEILEGSYFEPVQENKFDLIVANLPYVITPGSRFMYRDAAKPGDGTIRKLLQEIPRHLEEGGFSQLLINWPIKDAQSWVEPVQGYLKGLPLDAWLIFNGLKTPDEYARTWIDTETKKDAGLFETMRQAWLHWYQQEGIQQIGLGTLTLRLRSGSKNWFRAIPVMKKMEGQASEQFIRLFSAQDYLDNLDSHQDLLRVALHKVNVEIESNQGLANWVNSSKEMRIRTTLTNESMAVIDYLDENNSLKKAIQLAHPKKVVPDQIIQEIITDIEMLVQLGMLLPVAMIDQEGH